MTEPTETDDIAALRVMANAGDADAQTELALMYANGEGVPQDYGQAVAWTRKALEQGYAVAGWQGAGVSERRASVHLRGGHHCREASNTTLSG